MNEKILTLHGESKRSGKTVNRILSTVYCFYKYCCLILEIDNPIMMKGINRPQNMFKSLLDHTKRNNKTHKSIFKIKESESDITIISDAHIELVLNNLLTERDKLIFKTLYLTGARIGEILDLKIENKLLINDVCKHKNILKQTFDSNINTIYNSISKKMNGGQNEFCCF